jgi:excisionase family DNA binding protein
MKSIPKRNYELRFSKQVAAARKATQGSERLLTRPEIIALVGVTYPTIWKMMKRGEFPAARVLGGRSMWVRSEIDAWVAGLPVRDLKVEAGAAA